MFKTEPEAMASLTALEKDTILIYKGSAWVSAGTHAPDREIYPSVKSCDYFQAS